MPIPPETFSTARLTARKPCVEDTAAVFAAWAADAVATRYLSWRTYTETAPLAEFLRTCAEDWAKREGNYVYMFCLRGTDTPIGSIHLVIQGHKVMFGYVLARPHWGRGYMTEVLQHLLDWAMAQPEIQRGWAFCAAENPASARVMERVGMMREGALRRWQVFPNLGPEPRDCLFYAKVK